jgi:oxygen-independent coproporphyrinogen-3 oxidase
VPAPAKPPPLGLYLHLPWCVRKCPYCDFNSHAVRDALPEGAYVDALLADLEGEVERLGIRPVETIFIGGGTPSLFSPRAIERLLVGVRARIPCTDGAEVTLEANPGTVEQGRFREYRGAGVNRLSIGIQSFQDDLLARIGRIHGGTEARRAAAAAHEAGFDSFNLDLMVGLPGQTRAQALADVATACALAPDHISHYELTIEPNTLFHRAPPPLPPDDALAAMLEVTREALERGGYVQYEISAFARMGRRCRHNLNYWTFGDYLGLGAGAHGKWTAPDRSEVVRTWKRKHPRDYMARAAHGATAAGEQTLGEADLRIEFLMNALRLVEGVPIELFEQRTGLERECLGAFRMAAVELDLIEPSPGRLQPTRRGLRYLNDLLQLAM